MSEAHIEAVPADAFRAEVRRKVAEGLSPPRKAAPKGRAKTQSAYSQRDAAKPPETDVAAQSEAGRVIVEAKANLVSSGQVRKIVDSALRDVIGQATQVFILRGEPAVGKLIGTLVEQLPDVIASRKRALTERNIEALVDIFLGTDPLAAAMPALERDNAKAQARFLKTWPVLTAEAVAERANHASANRSATASRWKSAGRIFSVRAGGRDVYPEFQFADDGQPKPVIRKVLTALPPNLSGWQTAFWFVGANGWLDGEAPVRRLHDAEAVVQAAEQERHAWMG